MVTLKEKLGYGFGDMASSMFWKLFGSYLMIFYTDVFGLPAAAVGTMFLVTRVWDSCFDPLVGVIADRTTSKWGKFRPYLLITGLPTAVLLCLMAFIPNDINYWTKATLIGITYAFLMIFQSLYSVAFSSLAQVLTPNSEERTTLLSISAFIYNLGPSIVNLMLPILAGLTGGMTDFKTYRIFFPIFSAAGVLLGIMTFAGTKEKIVVPKDYVAKVKFSQGIKHTGKNKYFWLINLYSILGGLKSGIGSILAWYCVYQIQNEDMLGIMNTVIGTASVPGMLLSPLLAKKIGKKNIIIWSNLLRAGFAALMLFTMDSSALFFICLYLATAMMGGDSIVTSSMTAEIYDYQQWKTGVRLEGFITQFGSMLVTVAGMFTNLILPYFYEHYGLKEDYTVLYEASVRTPIFNILIITTIISCVICVIPMLFYNLNEKDHKRIMEELKIRAEKADADL